MPAQASAQAAVITSNTITRPADVLAYTSGDLVANSITAGSVTPFSFAEAVPSFSGVSRISRIRLRKSGTSLTGATFRVHLYRSTVALSNGDNGAWLTPIANYIGAVELTTDRAFTDGAEGAGIPLIGTSITYTIPTGTTLFALLEARGAYTPISGETFTLLAEVAFA